MSFGRSLGFVAVISAGALGCSSEAADVASDSVSVEPSEIANGSTAGQSVSQFYGMAAIYHPDDGFTFFPRPCSGTIFFSANNFTWILTARHCVTANAGIDGPLVNPSALRVLPGPNPGIANPNPPAAAVPAAAILAMSPASDMAMVGVARNWEALVTRFGMWVAAPQVLAQAQVQVTAFGYGINVFDTGCFGQPVTTGAGVARFGGPFTISSGGTAFQANQEASSYSFVNSSPSGQSVICGDSGGSDIAALGSSSTWVHLLGVHSGIDPSPGGTATTQTSIRWLQSQFSGFYLSPDQVLSIPRGFFTGANANVTRFPTGNSLWVVAAPSAADRWGYDPFTQRISLSGSTSSCMAPSGGVGSSVVFEACADVPRQRWTFGADRRFVNVALGSCLTTSGAFLSNAACDSSASQKWALHAQPYDFETYTHCADEGGTCSFGGTKNVRYGANGAFAYRTLSNGTACNNATFGDPIPGVPKKCSIGPNGFSFCAGQNGTCSFTGQKLVAYGANNAFYYRVFNGSAACTVGAFGGDPIVGVQKHCYVGG